MTQTGQHAGESDVGCKPHVICSDLGQDGRSFRDLTVMG